MNRTILFCVFFLSGAVLQAGRPFLTDDHGTVEKGGVELELGNELLPGRSSFSSSLTLKHGLTPRMEIDLGMGYDWHGTSPLNLLFKLHLLKAGTFHITASLAHDLDGAGNRYTLILARSSGRLALNVNVAGIDNFARYAFGISPVLALNDTFRIGLDLHGEGTSVPEMLLLGFGAAWNLTGSLSVDAGLFLDMRDGGSPLVTFGMVLGL